MNVGVIYMITSPSNNFYIGQTTSFNRRMNAYKNFESIKNQKALKNSLKKYGFYNHKVDILIECEKCELDFWECFYIKIFDSFNSGLNSTSGCLTPIRKRGYNLTEQWKLNISKSHQGKKREPFNETWIENISKSHKGIERTETWIGNLKKAATVRKKRGGYVKTKDQMDKFKTSIKQFFKTNDGLSNRKILSDCAIKRFSIPVLQIYDGKVVSEFTSARSAGKICGIAHSHIINCCNNKVKTAGGYVWQKKIDYERS